ncbi:hypothetical protein SCUCBS95973_007739 [Sporothrix curviconia]|uniref:Uncharacterized protein n=1 Tax=Sporothrix curviconia TaxID=1260050 RepID=A0ABP0CIN1_9PEZI
MGSPANTSPQARAMVPVDASGKEVLFAGVMRRCWHGKFASAADVLVALAEEIRATFSDEDIAYIETTSGLSLQGATVKAVDQKLPTPNGAERVEEDKLD